MNCQHIYNRLIKKALHRDIDPDQYYEKHHIVPRCLGGSDFADNLVLLTAREHFIAHLLLVKSLPGNSRLVKAAMMMSVCGSSTQRRTTNRVYEWLRKQHRDAMSESSKGSKNSQFGKSWIFDPGSKEEKKILKTEINKYVSNGWILGRASSILKNCVICNKQFSGAKSKKTCSDQCSKNLKFKHKVFVGREQEFLELYKKLGSMNTALKAMGFKGAVSHYYKWAKSLL